MRIENTIWCDGCGVEILGRPVIVDEKQYCCQDCSNGLECDCLGWEEQEDDHTKSKESQIAGGAEEIW